MFGGSKKSSTFALANEKQPLATYNSGALVQSVRISACHAGGHEFESRTHRTQQRKKEAFRLPFLHLSLYIEIGFQHFHIFLKGFQSRGGDPTESAWLFALEGFLSP